MPLISVYSDGSSGGKRGTVGFAWLIESQGHVILSGSKGDFGTNNTAEMQGAIHGLWAVLDGNFQYGNEIELVSDSKYVLGLASGEFIPKKNVELAETLQKLTRLTGAKLRWVKGHNGDAGNNIVDNLARQARKAMSKAESEKARLEAGDKTVEKAMACFTRLKNL